MQRALINVKRNELRVGAYKGLVRCGAVRRNAANQLPGQLGPWKMRNVRRMHFATSERPRAAP